MCVCGGGCVCVSITPVIYKGDTWYKYTSVKRNHFLVDYYIHAYDANPFASKKWMILANDFSFKKCHKCILWITALLYTHTKLQNLHTT